VGHSEKKVTDRPLFDRKQQQIKHRQGLLPTTYIFLSAKCQNNHGEHSNGGSEGSHRDAAMQSLVSSRELPDEVSTVGSSDSGHYFDSKQLLLRPNKLTVSDGNYLPSPSPNPLPPLVSGIIYTISSRGRSCSGWRKTTMAASLVTCSPRWRRMSRSLPTAT